MKQILIRHTDDISEEDAFYYAWRAYNANKDKTGIVVFHNNIIVEFSDYSKYPSMTVFRKQMRIATSLIEEEK